MENPIDIAAFEIAREAVEIARAQLSAAKPTEWQSPAAHMFAERLGALQGKVTALERLIREAGESARQAMMVRSSFDLAARTGLGAEWVG